MYSKRNVSEKLSNGRQVGRKARRWVGRQVDRQVGR